MLGMKKRIDFEALDHREAPEVLAARKRQAEVEITFGALQREEQALEERIAALPAEDMDQVIEVLRASPGTDVDALVASSRVVRDERERLKARLVDVRRVLRNQDRVRRSLESATEAAMGAARAERAEAVRAAYTELVEQLASVLRKAALINAELRRLDQIAGGVASWPHPWGELRDDAQSRLGLWLRTASEFGAKVQAVDDVADPAAGIGARQNARRERRAEIERRAEEIEKEEGKVAARRYLDQAITALEPAES